MSSKTHFVFPLLAVSLASCAPSLTQASSSVSKLDFSGQTAPVGVATALKPGTCARYAASFRQIGLNLMPVPLSEGGLWSYLVPVESGAQAGGASVIFTSKNNGAVTPNLYVSVNCQQVGSNAQFEVRTTGPLPLPRLKSVSERFVAALR